MKWLGGKRKLAPAILERLPSFTGTYWEPFAGGAAVFCALANTGRLPGLTVLSDVNAGLMGLYQAVQTDPKRLLAVLDYLCSRYALGPEALYYEQRDLWNQGLHEAFRFLFLKGTSFNGLYRVNAKGKLNAAWGKYPAPQVPSHETVWAWHEALRNVELKTGSFLATCRPQPGDLVYADPPYTGTFDRYAAGGFSDADQVVLLKRLAEWSSAGVHVAYSNSVAAEPLVDEHWPSAVKHRLSTRYLVNRDGAGRGLIEELFVVHDATQSATATLQRAADPAHGSTVLGAAPH